MTELPTTTGFPHCHGCVKFRSGPAAGCLACASRQLSQPGPDACAACSQLTGEQGRCPNELCRSPRRRIGTIHAIGYQAGALRRVIRSYKYGGIRSWSVVLGRLVLAWFEENMACDLPDLIVANPTFTSSGCQSDVGGPPFAHTEAVLRAAEQGWFDLSNSESPEFTGRVIAALFRDPGLMERSGQVLVAARVAVELGVRDIDGRQPVPLTLETL